MPTADDVRMMAADLLSHAGHIDARADSVAQAKLAAEATSPGPDAYGQLCWMVPRMLGELQSRVVDGIESGARSLWDVADQLRLAAHGYADADAASAATIQDVQDQPW